MKKLLSILILSFLFISCEEPPKREIVGECGSEVEIIKNDISSDIETQTLTYKGHDYIMFRKGSGKFATMGIEHDPDCKTCKTKNDIK
jgi:serine protease inhibitor ecotin